MVKKNNFYLVFITCLLALVAFTTKAFSRDISFNPVIKAEETYSDNVNLSLDAPEVSWVTQIGLMLKEEYKANKAGFNFESESIYALYSHDSKINSDYHTVKADGHLDLWSQGLSLVATASIDNVSRNVRDNSLADIVTGDTVQVKSYTSGINYDLANEDFSLSSALNYTDSQSEDNIGESEGYTATFSTQNGQDADYIFWDIDSKHSNLSNNGEDRKMLMTEVKVGAITSWKVNPFIRYFNENYDGNFGNQAVESNSYGVGFRWLVTPRVQLDISYNKPIEETYDENGDQFEEYIDTAILWEPSNRTKLTANFSQRFYGDSYGVSLSQRSKRWTNTINYSEAIEVFTRNNYEIDSPEEISPSEDDQFSLNKRLNWNSQLVLARTSFILDLGLGERTSFDDGSIDENKLASFAINRRMGGYSTLGFIASYTEILYEFKEVSENQLDIYRNISLNYTKRLNSFLDISFGISHLDRESNIERYNYIENRAFIKISKGF